MNENHGSTWTSREEVHYADDIFKCIFLNKNLWISLKISLKFVPKVPINNILALVQIMVWHRPGDKPLSEPMMVSLLSGVPDYFGRNKISSGGDLSHYSSASLY